MPALPSPSPQSSRSLSPYPLPPNLSQFFHYCTEEKGDDAPKDEEGKGEEPKPAKEGEAASKEEGEAEAVTVQVEVEVETGERSVSVSGNGSGELVLGEGVKCVRCQVWGSRCVV